MLNSKEEFYHDIFSYFNFTIENTMSEKIGKYILREKEDIKRKARAIFFFVLVFYFSMFKKKKELEETLAPTFPFFFIR